MEDNRDNLYNNIIKSGAFKASDLGDKEQFKSLLLDKDNASKLYSNLINSGKFDKNNIGDESSFWGAIKQDFKEEDLPNEDIEVSDYLDYTMEHEGVSLTAYPDNIKDGVQKYAIGFGFQTRNDKPVKAGDTITLEDAKAEFEKQHAGYVAPINNLKVHMGSRGKKAIFDFSFNAGTGAANKLVALINSGAKKEDVKKFLMGYTTTNTAKGRVEIKGLVNRRNANYNDIVAGLYAPIAPKADEDGEIKTDVTYVGGGGVPPKITLMDYGKTKDKEPTEDQVMDYAMRKTREYGHILNEKTTKKNRAMLGEMFPDEAAALDELDEQEKNATTPEAQFLYAKRKHSVIESISSTREYQEYEAASRAMYADSNIKASNSLYSDTEKMVDLYKQIKEAGTFESLGKGTIEGLMGYVSDYTSIVKNLSNNSTITSLQKKLEKGDTSKLTEDETILLEALQTNQLIHSELDKKLPRSYRVGEQIGASLGFMTEFVLTAGVGKGVATAIKGGSKAVGKRWITRQGKTAAAKMVQSGMQSIAMPMFYKDIATRVSLGEDYGSALVNAGYDTFKENLSERIFTGEFKGVGTENMFRRFITKTGSATANAKGLLGILKGTGEEILEEKFSDLMTAAKDATSFDSFIDIVVGSKEQNIQMFWTTAIMSTVLGAPSAVSHTRNKIRLNNAGRRIKGGLKGNIDEIMKDNNLSPKDVNDLIIGDIQESLDNGDITDEEARENYVNASKYAMLKYKDVVANNIKERKEKEEQIKSKIKEKKASPKKEGEVKKDKEEVKAEEEKEILDVENTVPTFSVSEADMKELEELQDKADYLASQGVDSGEMSIEEITTEYDKLKVEPKVTEQEIEDSLKPVEVKQDTKETRDEVKEPIPEKGDEAREAQEGGVQDDTKARLETQTIDAEKPEEDKIVKWLDNAIKSTDTTGKAFDATLGIPLSAVNASLKIVKGAYLTGKALAKAIADGMAYLKSKGHNVSKNDYEQYVYDSIGKELAEEAKEPPLDVLRQYVFEIDARAKAEHNEPIQKRISELESFRSSAQKTIDDFDKKTNTVKKKKDFVSGETPNTVEEEVLHYLSNGGTFFKQDIMNITGYSKNDLRSSGFSSKGQRLDTFYESFENPALTESPQLNTSIPSKIAEIATSYPTRASQLNRLLDLYEPVEVGEARYVLDMVENELFEESKKLQNVPEQTFKDLGIETPRERITRGKQEKDFGKGIAKIATRPTKIYAREIIVDDYKGLQQQIKLEARAAKLGAKHQGKIAKDRINTIKQSMLDFAKKNQADFTIKEYKIILKRLEGVVTSETQLNNLLSYIGEKSVRISAKVKGGLIQRIKKFSKKIKNKEVNAFVEKYYDMSEADVNRALIGLDAQYDAYNEEYIVDGDLTTYDKMMELENEMSIAKMVSNLDNKDINTLTRNLKELASITREKNKEVFAKIKERRDKLKGQAEVFASSAKGGFNIDVERTKKIAAENDSKIVKFLKQIKPGRWYFNNQSAFDYLMKSLNKTYELGKVDGVSVWNPKTWIGAKLSDNLRQANSKTIGLKKMLRMEFMGAATKIYGSISRAKKVTKTVVGLKVNKFNADGTKTIVEIPVSVGTLGHMWYSYNSEANSDYMKRLIIGNTKYELLEDGFDTIDQMLDNPKFKGIKEWTEWVADSFTPKMLPMISDVVEKLTGQKLLGLNGYLFVNATSISDTDIRLDNMDFVKVFQSMTRPRKGGYYDLTKNNIYDSTIDYLESTAIFVGSAEAVSDIVTVMNNKNVREVLKERGLDSTQKAMMKVLSNKFSSNREKLPRFVSNLQRNFVMSKVALNFGLLPKQLSSIFAVLDPDYVDFTSLTKAGVNLFQKENRDRANAIIKSSFDFADRSLTEIESLANESKKEAGLTGDIEHLINLQIAKLTEGMQERTRERISAMFQYIYMPTKYGDKLAIRVAGLPLIDAAYNEKLKELKDSSFDDVTKDKMAKDYALSTFEKWMNNTQQSSRYLDRSLFQSNPYTKIFFIFMNASRLYSDKVMNAATDFYKNYRSEIDLNKKGKLQVGAFMRANKSKSLRKLFIYMALLPVLFSEMGSGGEIIRGLLSDDEDERLEALKKLAWSATLDWTKGLFGIGAAVETMRMQALGVKFRYQSAIPILGDVAGFVSSMIEYAKTEDPETAKTPSKKRRLETKKSRLKTEMITTGVNALGLPGQRIKNSIRTKDFAKTDAFRDILYGFAMNKKQLELFGFDVTMKKDKKKNIPYKRD